MANVIRHKTSQPTKRGLRRGDLVLGTGEENYGPTSTTGYVAGITPPNDGYVVYTLGIGNNPAIYVANSDNDLISIAKTIANQNSHPFPTDIYRWVTAASRANLSRDTIESPVGNTPLLMSVTGNDPYTNSYNSSAWNITNAQAGETWHVSCWVKASQPCDGHFFIFGTNDAGSYSAVNDFSSNTFDIETEWQRFSFSRTFTNAAVTKIQIRLDGPDNGGSGIDVWWDGLQVSRGSDLSYFRDNSSSISNASEAKAYLASINDVWILDSIPNNTTTDGLIAHLQSNKLASYPESGTKVYDLSGNGNHGTLQNGTVFSNGVWELDGVNDRVDFNTNYPSSGTDPFSIDITFMVPTGATWYNQGSGTGIIGRGSYGGSIGIFRGGTEGNVHFWVRLDGGNIYDPYVTGLARDVYHRVVGTFDGNDTAKIYHNGEYIAQEVNSNNAGTFDAGSYLIGGGTSFGGNNGGYGQVSVSDVKVYNKALSEDEVSRNFYGGPIVTKDSSIFRHFTDTGNLTSKLNGTTLHDISGVSSDFTTEGTVTHSDSYGGVLHLNSGRIYRSQLGWYGKMATSWWMKYNGAVNAKPFYTENYRGSGGCSRISSPINANGTFSFSVWDNSSNGAGIGGSKLTTTTTNVCDGEWHHVTCQWSNGSGNQPAGIYVYVDGQLEGYTYMVGNDGGYQHWHLGGSYGCVGDNTHNCYLGPVMFYKNYNLTDAEVLQNYNAHKARFGK